MWITKGFYITCLLLLSLLLLGGTCGASGMYQVTESEIQTLSTNSKRLSEINTILQLGSTESQKTLLRVSEELKQSREELRLLKQELQRLQDSLQIAKSLSQSQQDLLTKTNESFQQYSQEQKAIQKSLKTERTIWHALAVLAAAAAALK